MGESIWTLHRYEDIFFSPEFFEPRPVLKALQEERGAVLLIDEVDKADEESEPFRRRSSPISRCQFRDGTVTARTRPYVFLTSNSTRQLSEALKRRCLHLFIPFPAPELEREIVRHHVPDIPDLLERQLVMFIDEVRKLSSRKRPRSVRPSTGPGP